MESKKISFGFSKTKKKSIILPQVQSESQIKDKEYITSFDKNASKLSEEKNEIIIPVKNNYSVGERISEKKRKEIVVTETERSFNTVDDVTIDQLAIRELLADAENPVESTNSSTREIKMNAAAAVIESSEPANYEEVPVSEFGYAMLKGMGWCPGKGIGKKQKLVNVHIPELRARGLGLGADAPTKDQDIHD